MSGFLPVYVEGTFTPALKFGGASVGMTYAAQLGRYTQTGRLVFIDSNIVLSAKGISTGDATVTGLPFAAAAGFDCELSWLLVDAALIGSLMPQIAGGASAVTLNNWSASAFSTVTHLNINNGTVLRLTGFYTI